MPATYKFAQNGMTSLQKLIPFYHYYFQMYLLNKKTLVLAHLTQFQRFDQRLFNNFMHLLKERLRSNFEERKKNEEEDQDHELLSHFRFTDTISNQER